MDDYTDYVNNTDIDYEEDKEPYYTLLALFFLGYIGCMCRRFYPNGSNEHVTQLLPTKVVETNEIIYSPDIHDSPECSICLEPYNVGETLTQLNCNHIYHLQCISDWLQRKPNCPLCRSS